ncbi:hypothetical protein, partial [Acinetobacter baumannii]|uniref:hypothetical protein n=1 Tax=Acinetobacter baumannii TaxID=470 RepID=UPI003397D05E
EGALPQTIPNDENIDSRWFHIRDAIYNSALEAFGKKERRNTDWYEAHWEEMEPVIEAKRTALLSYKQSPNPNTLDARRSAKKRAQKTARQCANTFWLSLSNNLQKAADTGNARGLFEG